MIAAEASTLTTAIPLADVRGELERALGQMRGDAVQIASISRRPSAYRTSYALEEVDVLLDDGTALAIVLKDVGPHALTASVRQVKPPFIAHPLREIATYQGILMPNGVSTPCCYGASVDPAAGHYWLFLERVPGVELYQVGDRAIWEGAARWLAGFHALFASQEARAASRLRAPLLEYDRDFYRRWPCRALQFARAWPVGRQRQIAWLTERYEPVIERLVSLPRTVIHGEFYASNVLVQESDGGLRVCPVDWEMAAVGPGLIDLAALVAGSWPEADRLRFVRAYHDAGVGPEHDHSAFDEFAVDLTFCRLHLAMQWLGWAADWTPPREQAHDWLREAVMLAEELSL
jgi:aminoglycoside/choline kinase family phosphotransferase